MSWSNKLRELRFEMGEMTQRELAERVGVSRQTINAIETNKHAPSLELAFRIADVFETSVEDVFVFDYEGKPDICIVTVVLRGGQDEIPEDWEELVASLP
jgi:putative transcriptional regulator